VIALQKGSRGSSVRFLQDRLAAKGFLIGPLDGDFGKQTDTAVRQFQAANNLKVDGVVGDKTWALLMSAPTAMPTDLLAEQRRWLSEQITSTCPARQRDVLEAAIATLGWKEEPDGSNGGPQVDVISTGYLGGGQAKPPWCALAVSYWLKQGLGGVSYNDIPFGKRLGAVAQIQAWGKSTGRFTKATASVIADPGCIFVMSRAGSGSDAAATTGAGHTGLVVADDRTHVLTIEGNTGNAVGSRRRRKTELSGFVTWW